ISRRPGRTSRTDDPTADRNLDGGHREEIVAKDYTRPRTVRRTLRPARRLPTWPSSSLLPFENPGEGADEFLGEWTAPPQRQGDFGTRAAIRLEVLEQPLRDLRIANRDVHLIVV